MITGVVKSNEGRIRLRVKGPRGQEREVGTVIDTGFTASLTLPPGTIAALGLRWRSMDRFELADGSERVFNVYLAKVDWDGNERTIRIHEADSSPLIGMRLLRGHELRMQVRSRGKVTIERLVAT
jgi:clan AA aspartic protease